MEPEGGVGVLVYTAHHHQRAATVSVMGWMKGDKAEMKQSKNKSTKWTGRVLLTLNQPKPQKKQTEPAELQRVLEKL